MIVDCLQALHQNPAELPTGLITPFLLYAADILPMTRTHIATQKLVEIFERSGLLYNLKLPYAKYKLLVLHDLGGQVRFRDGLEAKKVTMLAYRY
eukprot:2242543-Amphidinium_carterae.2